MHEGVMGKNLKLEVQAPLNYATWGGGGGGGENYIIVVHNYIPVVDLHGTSPSAILEDSTYLQSSDRPI